ncbi:hypothetical protein TPAR_01405, partial [Tolypocladium paradoxum]
AAAQPLHCLGRTSRQLDLSFGCANTPLPSCSRAVQRLASSQPDPISDEQPALLEHLRPSFGGEYRSSPLTLLHDWSRCRPRAASARQSSLGTVEALTCSMLPNASTSTAVHVLREWMPKEDGRATIEGSRVAHRHLLVTTADHERFLYLAALQHHSASTSSLAW